MDVRNSCHTYSLFSPIFIRLLRDKFKFKVYFFFNINLWVVGMLLFLSENINIMHIKEINTEDHI